MLQIYSFIEDYIKKEKAYKLKCKEPSYDKYPVHWR